MTKPTTDFGPFDWVVEKRGWRGWTVIDDTRRTIRCALARCRELRAEGMRHVMPRAIPAIPEFEELFGISLDRIDDAGLVGRVADLNRHGQPWHVAKAQAATYFRFLDTYEETSHVNVNLRYMGVRLTA